MYQTQSNLNQIPNKLHRSIQFYQFLLKNIIKLNRTSINFDQILINCIKFNQFSINF